MTLNKRTALITAVTMGAILNPLNTSMISLALTTLQKDFAVSFKDLAWFIALYYLISAIANPVMGKLSDIYGRKRFFLFGLVLIAIASLLAPHSPNLFWLTFFRSIQAWGCSTVYPAGLGIIRKEITTGQAKVLGILSIFATTAAAFGPTFGGFLLSVGQWSSIFYANLPLLIGSFIIAWKFIPSDIIQKESKVSIDYGGVVIFSVCIIFMMMFLMSLGEGQYYLYLIGVLILVTLFILFEKHQKNPFVNITGIMRQRGIGLVYLSYILNNIVFYTIMFGFPSFLQQVLGHSSSEAGLYMLALAGFAGLASPFVGTVIDNVGPKKPLMFGSLLLVVGTAGMIGLNELSHPMYYIAILAIIGLSCGIFNIALQAALYIFVPAEETGSATGLFMTSRFLGTILASSILGLLFGEIINVVQFHSIAMVCTVIGAAVVILITYLNIQIKDNQVKKEIILTK